MTVIPVSLLSRTDLHHPGNNLLPTIRRDREQALEPTRRSLASIGENNVAFNVDRDDVPVHDHCG